MVGNELGIEGNFARGRCRSCHDDGCSRQSVTPNNRDSNASLLKLRRGKFNAVCMLPFAFSAVDLVLSSNRGKTGCRVEMTPTIAD